MNGRTLLPEAAASAVASEIFSPGCSFMGRYDKTAAIQTLGIEWRCQATPVRQVWERLYRTPSGLASQAIPHSQGFTLGSTVEPFQGP